MKKGFFKLLLIFGILSVLSVAMSASVFGATASVTDWKLTYTVSGGEVTITKGTKTGSKYALEIPEKIAGYPVTKIGDEAFKGNQDLLLLTLPDSVVHIGKSAFEGTILYNVYGGGGLTYIDERAFYGCDSLETFTIADSVTYIGYEAFYNCSSLQTITIPKNITYIDEGAFKNCYKLTTAVIPTGITTINNGTFENCGLISIIISDSVESIKANAFSDCGSLESVVLSENLKTIESDAFRSCKNLKDISIPPSVESIGNYAFADCYYGLKSITIPEGVKTIGDYAFNNCYYLSEVSLSGSVKSIGNYAFYNCKLLEAITIPDGVESIGAGAFGMCEKLTGIAVSDKNQHFTSQDGVLFSKDKTVLIYYPKIRSDESYIIPDGVTSIDGGAFYNCDKLKNITIPDTVKTIGEKAFSACVALGDIHLPAALTTIESNAFANCNNLKAIVIPHGVTAVGEKAFSGCKSLIDITIPDTVTSIGSSAFSSTAYYSDSANWENQVLYIDSHLIYANNISGIYKVKEGTLSVADSAFTNCSNLTGISIPGSISFPDSAMFAFLANLKTVHLGNGIKTISKNMFNMCKKLESITIPNSITTIEDGAFYACSSLTKVYYKGTEEDWNNITVGLQNATVTNVADIIYLPFTKATVSENKKTFTLTPIGIENGKTVIIALYNGSRFAEMQHAVYNGESITFTVATPYTNAKVFVWDNLDTLAPVCESDIVARQ